MIGPLYHPQEAGRIPGGVGRGAESIEGAHGLFQAIFESAPVAIVMVDGTGSIAVANVESERMFGFGRDEMLGQKVDVLLPDRFRQTHAGIRADYAASPAARRMGAGQILHARRKDGTEFPVEIGLSPIQSSEGLFILAIVVDVTERNRQVDELAKLRLDLDRSDVELQRAQYRSHHDPLTGLANSSLFHDIVNHHLAICRRNGSALTLLYLDLDGFKAVNDAHGHAVGDALLRVVAERLKEGIRDSDVAARLGGDEFAIILVNSSVAESEAVIRKLAEGIAKPFQIAHVAISISVSIGTAGFPAAGASCEALLQSADKAMYKDKACRGNR